jgi:putative DNA primase/helicase
MAIDLAALRASIDIVAVIGSRVQLTKRGNELFGLCPFHDEHTESFSVTPDRGMYYCFGCGAGGDAIDFIRDLDGLSFQDACAQLGSADYKALPMKAGLTPRKPRLAWWSTVPPESDNKPASFALSSLGEPSMVWCYKTADGQPWGYVARYEVEHDGKKSKEIRQWTYGKDGEHTEGDCAWACKHFSKPRPIYNLQELACKPTAQVIIVEGEKTADAALSLFPQAVAVTWPGGTNAVENIDWSPLYGRRTVIVPDHDEPGQKACQYIAALLASKNCAIKIVKPEPDRPKGWDLADAVAEGWTPEQAMNWAKLHATVYKPMPDVPPAIPVNEPPEAKANGKPTRKTRQKGNLSLVDGNGTQEAAEALPPAFSHVALAARMTYLYGETWRYVIIEGKKDGLWRRWTGKYWEQDRTGTVKSLATEMVVQMVNYEQGNILNNPSAQRSVCSDTAINSVISMWKTDQKIVTIPTHWDTNPWLLGTPDGVVDLKSGLLRPSNRTDQITKLTSVVPSGDCPRWLVFLKRVTNEDADLQAYLQRLCGYCLTGVTSEQVMGFLYGTGANGKSVFIKTISAILKDYATPCRTETFAETKNDRHLTEWARLAGYRLVSVQEVEEGRRWAESKIKEWTSGDPIVANYMHQDHHVYTPTGKLLISGNNKPGLRTVDEAIKRRMHIIPFTVTIPPDERDPMLEEKLREEHASILAWMVAGCLEWQRIGLAPPLAVTTATEDYLENEDILGDWVSECLDLGGDKIATVAETYKSYVEYCERVREHAWGKKRLSQHLQARGYKADRNSFGRFWVGFTVKESSQSQPESRW